MDIRKGRKVTRNNETIDTEPGTELRIQETIEWPAKEETHMPLIHPAIQKDARKKQHLLRQKRSKSRRKNNTAEHAPLKAENEA